MRMPGKLSLCAKMSEWVIAIARAKAQCAMTGRRARKAWLHKNGVAHLSEYWGPTVLCRRARKNRSLGDDAHLHRPWRRLV